MREQCGKKAVRRYTWPGRDESFICREHLPKLLGVATAIGLYVQIIELDDDTDKTCAQEVEKAQP